VADLYYIEEGYWDPSLGYYVYTADAAATLTASATIDCDATKLAAPLEADATLASTFTQTTAATRIQTAVSDVSAVFSESAIAGKIISVTVECGALFSPGITAIAFKNHTAILEVVFTVNTVGVANRAITMAVDAQANLDAQAAKTVDAISAFNTTATTSISATKSVTASSTLSSAFTVSVDALSVQLAQAAIVSTSSLTTTRYFGTGRPRNLGDPIGGFNATAKFGSASLAGYYEAVSPNLINKINTNNSYAVEFYYYRENTDARLTLNYTNWFTITSGSANSTARSIQTFRFYNGSATVVSTFVSSALAIDQWHHILIIRDISTNVSAIFINGTRVHTYTGDVGPHNGAILIDNTGFNSYIDEFSIHTDTTLGYSTSSSTITVPTAARVNDFNTTQFLYHFDGNGNDDIFVSQIGEAALTSQFSVSASAQELSSAQAALAITATVSAQATVNKSAQSELSSSSTVSATATRIQLADSAVACEFALTSAVNVVRSAVASTASEFTQSADVARTRTVDVAITSAFTPTLSVDAFKNHTAILDCVSTLSANITVASTGASDIAAVADLTAAVARTRTASADVASSTALSATSTRTQSAQADLASTSTLTAQAGEEVDATGSWTTAFTTEIQAVKTTDNAASAAGEFTQSADVARTRSTAVNLSHDANLSVTAVKINTGTADLATTTTVSVSAVKTTDVVVTASSQFQQSTVAVKTVRVLTEFTSIASQLTVAFQNATGTVLLESSTALTAIIGAIKQGIPERAITGIRFNDDAATELGDNFIKIAHYNPSGGPSLSDRYAVAFWAYSPEGTVLTHHPTGDYNNGYMKFTEGSFELRSPFNSADYRTATWTGLSTTGWHHYIVYQEPISGAVNPVVKLYQDGVLKTDPTIFTFSDGNEPPTPPSDDLLAVYFETQFSYLHWAIGAQVNRWRDNINEISNAARTIEPMQGVLSQFVSYWTTVPDFTDSATRLKLYNEGYVDLGNLGTLSGLTQPNIYLRLQNHRDVRQLGSLDLYANAGNNGIPPAPRLEWREISQFGYNPAWDNQDWTLSSLHEGSAADDFGLGFLAIADLECSVSGVFLFELPINAESVMSVSGARIRTGTVNADASAAVQAQGQGVFGLTAALSANTTAVITGARTRTTAATISASSTMFVEEGELLIAFANLSSAFTLACEPTEIEAIQGGAALTSEFTLAADVNNVLFISASASSQTTLAVDATVIPPVRAEAALTATTTLSAIIGGRFELASLEVAAATLTATAVVTRGARSTITATATVFASTSKQTGIAPTTLQVAGFVLVAGDIINLEPSLTYYIPQETRSLLVLPESRLIEIEQETRQLTLLEG
jgi:hypothetical protein